MSDDTMNTNSNANSTSKNRQDFTKAKQQQAYEISKLPQPSQEMASKLEDIYTKRLNEEQNKQRASKVFRERGEKIKLLEDYVRSDAPRPNDPQAKENYLQIIDQRAKEIVAEKQMFYLNRIEQERHDTMEHFIKEEQQKQQEPTPEQSVEPIEPEPEQEL